MKLQIETFIQINAPVEQVWEQFVQFDTYKSWNPFIKEINGEIKQGQKIKVVIDGMKFTPVILKFDKKKELRWRGILLMAGLFQGEHYFQLKQNTDGTTTFLQAEKFSGVLVRMFQRKLNINTRNGFEAMNKALKERVEANQNNGLHAFKNM